MTDLQNVEWASSCLDRAHSSWCTPSAEYTAEWHAVLLDYMLAAGL